jgi:asparaginyl-tRNA synthetase
MFKNLKSFTFPTLKSVFQGELNKELTIKGFIKTKRTSKKFTFIELSDGTTQENLQGIISNDVLDNINLTQGSAVTAHGQLTGTERKQMVEFHISKLNVDAPSSDNPIAKRIPLTTLRQFPHLRSRTNTFQSLWRVRSSLQQSIHDFFTFNDFLAVNPPILTINDAEGAGECFTIENSKEFFNDKANLTVSAQLHLEMLTQAMQRVYTLGPVFRAEKSQGNRHLAEFSMLETEVAHISFEELLYLCESQIKNSIEFLLLNRLSELKFFQDNFEAGLVEKLECLLRNDFKTISHFEAQQELIAAFNNGANFVFNPAKSIQTEHEKYLAKVYGPIFITHYPAVEKPFYMKKCGDLVECFDLCLPGWGEVVGGSLREDNYDLLKDEIDMSLKWYLDLRRFGGFRTGGYGLGIERLLGFCTGIQNVRDLVPLPRTFQSCRF